MQSGEGFDSDTSPPAFLSRRLSHNDRYAFPVRSISERGGRGNARRAEFAQGRPELASLSGTAPPCVSLCRLPSTETTMRSIPVKVPHRSFVFTWNKTDSVQLSTVNATKTPEAR
jgi:hypothetical protein